MRAALRLPLLALLCAAALAGCKKPEPPPRPAPTPAPTPVPANDIIAFTRMGQLWATNWNGSQTRILAAPGRGQGLWFPHAAADGSYFLAWLSRPNGTQDVVRVDLNGRISVLTDIGETALPAMKNLRLGNAPALSPDSKRIAYSFNGNLWVMDANGYNAETLIGDGSSWSPSFSPDGKLLAYVNGTQGKFDLWVADLESRDTWQITDFAAHSVGHPRWSRDGRHLVLTRSQGDESNIVQVLASTETPLADADVITKDNASASAVFSPSHNRLLFSSQRGDGKLWVLVSSDPTGADAKPLLNETALSPAWLRPSSVTAAVFDSAPSRPTPTAPKPTPAPTVEAALPTSVPTVAAAAPAATAAPAAPTVVAAAPAQAPPQAQAPVAASASASSAGLSGVTSGPKPSPTTGGPSAASPASRPAEATASTTPAGAPVRPTSSTAPAQAGAPKPSAAPTQPAVKAAPLRLRYKASFADDESLSPASLADLKKLAPRVKQYDSAKIQVIGPLDGSSLRGRHASAEARSRVRAQSVATALAKLTGIEPAKVQAQPYSPATAGSGAPNSIQVYVELR